MNFIINFKQKTAKIFLCLLAVGFISITVSAACSHSGGEANCMSPAICEKCGATYGEKNPENHIGGTVLQNQKGVDCGNAGYSGDTYCASCNTLIEMGVEIAPTGDHNFIESTVIKAPTTSEKGILQSKCSVCEKTVTEEIEMQKSAEQEKTKPEVKKAFLPILIVVLLISVGTVIYYNVEKSEKNEEEKDAD